MLETHVHAIYHIYYIIYIISVTRVLLLLLGELYLCGSMGWERGISQGVKGWDLRRLGAGLCMGRCVAQILT